MENTIKFPNDKLFDDLELQRADVKRMSNLKQKILSQIKDDDLFVLEEYEEIGEDGEKCIKSDRKLNNNLINNIINLNDSCNESYKTLAETYHKFAKNIEYLEKANKCKIESSKIDEPEQKSNITKVDPVKLLNNGHNIFNSMKKKA